MISDRINSSTKKDQGEDLHPEDERQDQLDGRGSRKDLRRQRIISSIHDIDGRGFRRASASSGGEREVVHFGTRIGRTSIAIKNQVVYFSLTIEVGRKEIN